MNDEIFSANAVDSLSMSQMMKYDPPYHSLDCEWS